MQPIRFIARASVASLFITAGVDTLRNPGPRAELAAPVISQLRGLVPGLPEDDAAIVRVNGAVHLAAGVSLFLGRFERLSALALLGTLLPTTAGGHRFWEYDDKAQRKNQQVHLFKNLAIGGGLIYAVLDRGGKPSLSWRASRAAKQTQKQTKIAAKKARNKVS